MIALLWASWAAAAPKDVEFCVEITTYWADNDVAELWSVNNPKKGRGVYLEIEPIGEPLAFSGQVSDTTGCLTIELDTTKQYLVRTSSSARVNGVQIDVYKGASDVNNYVYHHYTSALPFDPLVMNGATLTLPATSATAVLAVGTFMMHRNNMGLGGAEAFIVAYDECVGSNCYVFDGSIGVVHAYGGVGPYLKLIIAHEIAHAIAWARDGRQATQLYYFYGAGACDGESALNNQAATHSLTEAEYQSAAGAEGFADFIAAWTWNQPAWVDATCSMQKYPSDFDLDGILDNDADGVSNCGGVPLTGLPSYVTAEDWLEDLAIDTTLDPLGCFKGNLNQIGTEYDWTRYFWSMHADHQIPVAHLVDIFDLADPRSWDPDHNGVFSLAGDPTTIDDPIVRMEAAADSHPVDANGYSTEHDAAKVHGLDH